MEDLPQLTAELWKTSLENTESLQKVVLGVDGGAEEGEMLPLSGSFFSLCLPFKLQINLPRFTKTHWFSGCYQPSCLPTCDADDEECL